MRTLSALPLVLIVAGVVDMDSRQAIKESIYRVIVESMSRVIFKRGTDGGRTLSGISPGALESNCVLIIPTTHRNKHQNDITSIVHMY